MKAILISIHAVALALFICGCANISETENAVGTVAFEFWTVEERYAAMMNHQAERFNEKDNDRNVQVTTKIYSRNQLGYKLATAMQSATNVPDIVDISYREFSGFIHGVNLMVYPLNTIASNPESGIYNPALEPFTFSGNCYAIPYARDRMVLFYNSELLDKYGLDAYQIKTWSEFTDAGKRVIDSGGPPMLLVDVDNSDLLTVMMIQENEESIRWSASRIMASGEYRDASDRILEMTFENRILAVAPNYNIYNSQFYSAFESGNVVGVLAPVSYAFHLTDNAPEIAGKVTMRPVPQIDGADTPVTPFVAQYATAITAQCKDINFAKDFLRFAKTNRQALIDATTILYCDNISDDITIAKITPDDEIYTGYFTDNAANALFAEGETEAFLTGDTGLIEAGKHFALTLLSKIDERD